MKPSDSRLADLARLVNATSDREFDCAEVLDRVAAYLERVTDQTALSGHLQQVARHLKICPECREEFVALVRAEGLDPGTILLD